MSAGVMRQPLSPARFRLISHWHLDAPAERVWAALTETGDWPAWWPYVRAVRELRPGTGDGFGARHHLAWGSRLPYGLSFEAEVIQAQRPWLLRARVRGDLNGMGTWELTPAGGGTRLRYLWCVEPGTRWMRLLAPLAGPVFRWNHAAVMRAGAQGLARHLGVRLLEAR
jgi:uncharacterized protein YndB with AHSA1/START domain